MSLLPVSSVKNLHSHLAIRLIVLFPKVGLSKGLVAMRAHKVLWVPHAVQRRHGAADDGLTASSAHLFKHAEVIFKAKHMEGEKMWTHTQKELPLTNRICPRTLCNLLLETACGTPRTDSAPDGCTGP